MADNTLLKYFFSSGSEVDPEGQFNLTRLGGRAKGLRDAGPLRKQELHGLPPCLAGFSRCPYGYNAQLLGAPIRLSCQLAGLARADNPSASSRRETIAAASENRCIPQRSIIW